MEKPLYSIPVGEVLEKLSTSERGLENLEVSKRLLSVGRNTLPESKSEPLPLLFLHQFASPLIYALLVASAVMYLLGDTTDAVIILFVLLFNATVGTIQEGRAAHTLRALKKLGSSESIVRRDGIDITLPDSEIVPGDIVILEAGNRVPADARLIYAERLTTDEATLTGESEPIRKITTPIDADKTLPADQINMVFKGTHILSGTGEAVVAKTGKETEIGKISSQIASLNTEIPLKADIRTLSRAIVIAVVMLGYVIFAVGVFTGKPVKEMFALVVALAVSAIPEGLPIVLTLVLAVGVFRMSKKNALVKRLQAVEALGQAKIIVVDKTGTITKNELGIERVLTDGKLFEVTGSGYSPEGEIRLNGEGVDPANHKELLTIGRLSGFCAGAKIDFDKKEGVWKVHGEPTEAALLVLSRKLGFHKETLERESPLLLDIPFDFKTKYHATVHSTGNGETLAVIGAPENVMPLCNKVFKNGVNEALNPEYLESVTQEIEYLASSGLRILAISSREGGRGSINPNSISDLTLIGFVALRDSIRSEAKSAIALAEQAGLKIIMATGDNKITALAVAREAGIRADVESVMTGVELEMMDDSSLDKAIPNISVFARVTPDHKLRIIQSYKRRGEIIAMTGDGVNDAPSLVAADLGISMGKIGTEVAKEASDIVLLDDNLGSIVSAIEEGRNIYKTIQKVIIYLFSTSIGEVTAITIALFLGLPLPLLAAQIIWLNLVTDGFLDVALAMEPKESGLLSPNFKRGGKYLIDRKSFFRMIFMALPMAVGSLILFASYLPEVVLGDMSNLTKAWTISLTTLAVFQWFNAWNCRSDYRSLFRQNIFENPYLILATIIIVVLHLFAVYHPFFQGILHTTALSLSDWAMIIPVAGSIIIVEEIRKLFFRMKNPQPY